MNLRKQIYGSIPNNKKTTPSKVPQAQTKAPQVKLIPAT
jgi:hypothetical protein